MIVNVPNLRSRAHTLVRGGPFDMGGGAMFFLLDQTLFYNSQLKRIFFQTLSKANNFFLSSRIQNNFFFTVYSPHTILSS